METGAENFQSCDPLAITDICELFEQMKEGWILPEDNIEEYPGWILEYLYFLDNARKIRELPRGRITANTCGCIDFRYFNEACQKIYPRGRNIPYVETDVAVGKALLSLLPEEEKSGYLSMHEERVLEEGLEAHDIKVCKDFTVALQRELVSYYDCF